jgi:hypothetical protein
MMTYIEISMVIHWRVVCKTYILRAHLLRHHVRLASQSVVASELAKAFCASVQDVRRARLGQAEEEEDQTEAGEPHEFPDRPCPTLGFNGKATNKGTEHWSTNSANTPNSETVRLLLRTIHVGNGRATRRKRRRPEEARQESEREEHAKIDRKECRQLEQDENC